MYSGTAVTNRNGKHLPNYEKRERTSAQLAGFAGELSGYELDNKWEANYKTYQEMLSDPTIAFARMLCVAPLTTVGWSYEAKDDAPDGAKECIQDSLEPWRINLVKSAMEGYIDYGWSGYEMVYSVEDNQAYLCKVKHLLQAQTLILVAVKTGEYLGLRQFDWRGQDCDLGIYDSLHIAIDVEGTNWYGRPLLENARKIFGQWNQVNDSANKYDTKIAGASWVVYYPVGDSPYNGMPSVDNYLIALDFLNKLQANGRLAVPMTIAKWQTDMNVTDENAGWKIELISDKGVSQAGFIDRQKYLDALKVRAFGLPERAVLEGQFGTKAESEAQADFAITVFEMRHQIIVQQINKQITNFLLATNYGEEFEDTVIVKANPLVDEKRMMLEKIYMAIIGSPEGLMQEMQALDMQSFRKSLDLPENQLLAQNGLPAAQGLLSEYFAELYGMPKPQPSSAAGVNSVRGQVVIPPEYWAKQQKGIALALQGYGRNTSAPQIGTIDTVYQSLNSEIEETEINFAFDPSKHPHEPAGSPKGGQFASTSGGLTPVTSRTQTQLFPELIEKPTAAPAAQTITEPQIVQKELFSEKTYTGYSEKDAKRLEQLNKKWAKLNNDYLRLADEKYDGNLVITAFDSEANHLMEQQTEITYQRYELLADPGGVEASMQKPGGVRDVVIIGGGPGGMEAATMAGTEQYDTLLLEGSETTGGQSRYSSRIENFNGFPIGLTGQEKANLDLKQAHRVGAEIRTQAIVTDMRFNKEDGTKTITMANGEKIRARVVVIGGGIRFQKMDFPGVDSKNVVYQNGEKLRKLCVGKTGVVIGGGNGAAQAALDCAKTAERVYIVARSPIKPGMTANVYDTLVANKKITVIIGEVEKYENGTLHTTEGSFQANGIGIFVGGKPDTDWIKDIEMTEVKKGIKKVKVNDSLETSMPGVYAVGDIRTGSVPRIAAATGDGAAAIGHANTYFKKLIFEERKRLGRTEET